MSKGKQSPTSMNTVITLLVIIAVLLVVVAVGITRNKSNTPSSSQTTSRSQELTACNNAANQKYNPEIAAAMSNGTSEQPVTMEQEALATCQQEYGN